MKKNVWFWSLIIIAIFFVFANSCKKDKEIKSNNSTPAATVTDIDGNVYHTVTIDTIVWMVENLKVTRYRNGDTIPNVDENPPWQDLTTGALFEYALLNNTAIYGRLYNWYAVNDNRNLAPTGWHVATQAEWRALIDFLGGDSIAGGKLKEAGTIHWASPNTGATNSCGFTALPGGFCWGSITTSGFWWTSTENMGSTAYYSYIVCDETTIYNGGTNKNLGCSVRCVKD